MAEEMKHTPTPWTTGGFLIKANGGTTLIAHVSCAYYEPDPESEANAEFIVRAVNSHHTMLDALRTINRIASPNPERTFDQVIRDLDYIVSAARSGIAASGEKG